MRDRDIAAMVSAPAAVGKLWESVPDPRLSQDLGPKSRRARCLDLWLPDEPRGAHSRGLVRQAGGARRSHRRRHRHARQPHRAYPHVDIRFEPCRLAQRPRALAGEDARDRGSSVGRTARAVDAALRRCAHQRADEGYARQGRAARRVRRRRRHPRREPFRRPPQGLPVPARPRRRGHPRQGDTQCCRTSARSRAFHARPPCRRRTARRAAAQSPRPRPVA